LFNVIGIVFDPVGAAEPRGNNSATTTVAPFGNRTVDVPAVVFTVYAAVLIDNVTGAVGAPLTVKLCAAALVPPSRTRTESNVWNPGLMLTVTSICPATFAKFTGNPPAVTDAIDTDAACTFTVTVADIEFV
jgi:hypothetical protein